MQLLGSIPSLCCCSCWRRRRSRGSVGSVACGTCEGPRQPIEELPPRICDLVGEVSHSRRHGTIPGDSKVTFEVSSQVVEVVGQGRPVLEQGSRKLSRVRDRVQLLVQGLELPDDDNDACDDHQAYADKQDGLCDDCTGLAPRPSVNLLHLRVEQGGNLHRNLLVLIWMVGLPLLHRRLVRHGSHRLHRPVVRWVPRAHPRRAISSTAAIVKPQVRPHSLTLSRRFRLESRD
mmetsp:Transcript_5223/g.15698  ORF Transcript_5223/g.15698 Transcript_5223/m.15698 type:complete len:232 (+) Transcript_5223:442-1137(+)